MAKKSAIQKMLKKEKLIEQYAERRAELKAKVVNFSLSFDERMEARDALNKLPRNSSKVRHKNRCSLTGRPKGYMRRFGISRITFRELSDNGLIPGVTTASW